MARLKRFTKRISVRISMELHLKIKKMAAERGVSMAQICREAIESALADLEKKGKRAALKKDLLDSREF